MTANGNTAVETPEKLPAEVRAGMLADETSVFLNVAKWEQMQRAANMLSMSDFVPSRFRGKIGNCLIALDMAHLMGMHPLMLMRCMYVVHGEPGFEGKFASALVNNSNRYTDPLEYEWKGVRGKDEWGCRAFATRKSTGKVIHGPWVDWSLVVAEGWNKDKPYYDKGGNKKVQKSKWNTMPELMFMYRSATFFARVHDSDLLMGMKTVDELEDVHQELSRQPDGSYSVETNGNGSGDNAGLYNTTQEPPKHEEPAADQHAAETEERTAENQQPNDVTTQNNNEKKEEPQTTGSQSSNWNPFKSEIQKRYGEDKREILKAFAGDIGIDVDGKLPREIHQELIDHAKKQQDPTTAKTETQEAGQVSSENEPDPVTQAEMEMMDRFDDLWNTLPEAGRQFACINAKCRVTTNGPLPPDRDQVATWMKFAKQWLAENSNDGGPEVDAEVTDDDLDTLELENRVNVLWKTLESEEVRLVCFKVGCKRTKDGKFYEKPESHQMVQWVEAAEQLISERKADDEKTPFDDGGPRLPD